KGKVVDLLAMDADLVRRGQQGGDNAGHTVVVGLVEYDFQVLPNHSEVTAVPRNGVVIHLPGLSEEAEKNLKKGPGEGGPLAGSQAQRSDRAHIVFDFHQAVIEIQQQQDGKNLGTTRKGIGPVSACRASHTGLCICDLLADFHKFTKEEGGLLARASLWYPSPSLSRLWSMLKGSEPVKDGVYFMHQAPHRPPKKILVNGASAGYLLCQIWTYPFVTSLNCTVRGICTGLGIPPCHIRKMYGVVKAYTTWVGFGTFPTEQDNEVSDSGERNRENPGATPGEQGRSLACPPPLTQRMRHAHMINGFSVLALTKLDILDSFPEIKVGMEYLLEGKPISYFPANLELLNKVSVNCKTLPCQQCSTEQARSSASLPSQAQSYVYFIECYLGVPVKWVSVGKFCDSIKIF
uniref:Adenylosuccinate synthetase n=1 Tax=Pelodiscus sinensis TaxID=13735 RepID=K7G070_PELSI